MWWKKRIQHSIDEIRKHIERGESEQNETWCNREKVLGRQKKL